MTLQEKVKHIWKFWFGTATSPVPFVTETIPRVVEKFPDQKLRLVKRFHAGTTDVVIGFMNMGDDIITGTMFPYELTCHESVITMFDALNTKPGEIPTLTITKYDMRSIMSRQLAGKISSLGETEYCFLAAIPFHKELTNPPHFLRMMFIQMEHVSFEYMRRSVNRFENPTNRGAYNIMGIDSMIYMLGKHNKGPFIVHYQGKEIVFYTLTGEHIFSIEQEYDGYE